MRHSELEFCLWEFPSRVFPDGAPASISGPAKEAYDHVAQYAS